MRFKIIDGRSPTSGWSRLLLAVAALFCCGLIFVASGRAAPVSYYQLPGTSDQWIEDLTADGDGTLWVAQSLSQGQDASENHMRILHLGSSGNVIASTAPAEGSPYGTKLVPAADGGIWELSYGNGLRHLDATGAGGEIALPHKSFYPETLTAGHDGRAWIALCQFVFGEPQEEICSAAAVSPDGNIQEVPLSGISDTWPAGATSAGGYVGSVTTSAGVWFWRMWNFNGGPSTTSAAFVSYDGTASKVDVPANSRIAAPGPDGSVWWIQDEGKGGATLGRITPAGVMSDVHHVGNVSEMDPADPFVGDPGRNDNLLWAQNATWSESYDGQIGVVRPDGSITEYKVAKDASTVPTSIPDFWSGTCSFGVRLYEAIDGSLWTISGGHPPRLTRQQPSGAFETYLLGNGASAFANEEETGVWGMVETDPRSLYFSLNSPSGPQLARLDPLDPPPAEPPYPKQGTVAYGRSNAQRIQRLLRALIQQTRRSVGRLQQGSKKLRLRANFPVQGTVDLVVELPRRKKAVLLSAAASGSPGPHSMRLRLHGAVRSLLRSNARRQAVLKATFTPTESTPVRRTAKLPL